ncbi:hypothetical protein [Paenibacillus sp. CMAA1364]
MTEEQALHAMIEVTGIPADLLIMDSQSYEGCYIYISNLSQKTYYVESNHKMKGYTEEEMKDIKIIGEYEELCVYEMTPWWQELL